MLVLVLVMVRLEIHLLVMVLHHCLSHLCEGTFMIIGHLLD